MPVHYFVRFRPPPGDGRGIREMTLGSRRFSADVGWVLLDRAFAVSLQMVHHPDHKARAAFSYAFNVVSVEYPDQSPHWGVSAEKPVGAMYEACLDPVPWNEFRGFAYGGHIFSAEAGWLPVTREQAEFLDVTRAQIGDVRASSAFLTRLAYQPPAERGGPATESAAHPRPVRIEPPPERRVEALAPPDLESAQYDDTEPGSVAQPDKGAVDDVEQDSDPLPLGDRVLAQLQAGPLGAPEIARALGLSSVSGYLKRIVLDLLERGAIDFAPPEKIGSRLRRYQLVTANQPASAGPEDDEAVGAATGDTNSGAPEGRTDSGGRETEASVLEPTI